MTFFLLVTTLAWFFLPGLLLGYLLRFRDLALVLGAPVLSVGTVGLAAFLSTFIRLPDFRWQVLLLTAILAGLAFMLVRLFPALPVLSGRFSDSVISPSRLSPTWQNLLVAASAVIGFAINGVVFWRSLGDTELTPSLWDLPFHLHLARWTVETGNASPFHAVAEVSGTTPTFSLAFYPNSLSTFTALNDQGNVMLVMNVGQAVYVGAFAAGMVVALSALFPFHWWMPPLTAFATVNAIAFSAKLHATGGRWSYGFGFALVPWAFGLAVVLWRHAARQRNFSAWAIQLIPTLLMVIGSLVFAHPGALYLLLILSLPAAVPIFCRARHEPHLLKLALALNALVFGLFLSILIYGGAKVGAIKYSRISEFPQAIIEGLSGGEMSRWYRGYDQVGSWAILILVCLSLAATIVLSGRRWIAATYLIALALYVASVTVATPWYFLLHPLYNDRTRTSTALSFAMPLLIVGGMLCIYELLMRRSEIRLWHLSAQLIPLIAIIALLASGLVRANERYFIINSAARITNKNLVESSEVALMRELAQKHPGAGVIGHPATGSTLYYPVTGAPSLPRYTSLNVTSAELKLMQQIDQITAKPEICKLAKQLNIRYFYYDADRYRSGKIGSPRAYAALLELEKKRATLPLVMKSGKVEIYELPQKCS